MLRLAVARVAAFADGVAMPTWLVDAERRRWHDMHPAARAEFAASRALLRELLQAATGVPFDAWHVSAEAGRAPVASADDPAAPRVHVSLSHRSGWVAAAVADTAVGIDVECDRPMRSDPAERAALMLSRADLEEWQAIAFDCREDALLARWTAKEAWFKAAPARSAPWDFRRVRARECARADARANVRTWRARPVHVALACADARALAHARCDGLPPPDEESWWELSVTPP